MAGAPAVRCPQRCTQPPAAFVPTQPAVSLPSICQPLGHFPAGEVPPGSAALGSENAASAVSGAPGLNLRPSEKGVRLAQKMQVGP